MTLFSLCKKIEKCDYPELGVDYSSDLKALVGSMVLGDMEKRIDADKVYDISKRMYEKFSKMNRDASKS